MFCDTMHTMKKLLLGLIFVLRITCAFGEPDTRDPAWVVTEVPGSAFTIFKAPSAGGVMVSTGTQNKFTFEVMGLNCALAWNGTDFVCASSPAHELMASSGTVHSDVNNGTEVIGDLLIFTDLATDKWARLAVPTAGSGHDYIFVTDQGGMPGWYQPTACSSGSAATDFSNSAGLGCDGNVAFDDEPNTFTIDQTFHGLVNVDDSNDLRFSELDSNGSNYKAFSAPNAVTLNTTCVLEDDANFIPDSCVGNGTDDSSITIQELDGSPSIAAATVLQFDQADGFVVSNPSGTTAKVKLTVTGLPISGSGTINFADPGQNACTATQNVTVTGATAGHACAVGPANATTSIIYACNVTANTCAIKACKFGNAAEDPASQTYFCTVF